MDYLIEEVLETLDDTVKIFLLKTSILDRMCFALCDSITRSNNSFEMLNYLEKKNMFILPLDNERKWYRYHHLFAELLQRKLKSSFPEYLNDLHRQASEWFNENEYYDEAIHHLLVIKDHIRVAELVVKEASNIWSDGDHSKYQDWIDSIPTEIVDEIPHLLVLQAEVKMTLWEIPKSEELLEKALKKLESFENNSKEPLIPITKEEISGLKGRIKINFSQVASYHEKTNEIIHLVEDGLKLLDKDESTWRMVASISLGDAYYIQGDLINACKAQRIVENSIKSKTNPFLNLVMGGNLSVSLRHMGKLNEASDNCARLLKFAMDAGMTNTIVSGWIQCIFGELKTEVNDLNQAEVQLKSGISIAERYGAPGMLLMCYMYQLRLFFSTGKYDQIDHFVKRFEKDYSNQPVTNHIKNQISYWKLRVLSLKGEVEQIEVWLKGYENDYKNDFLYIEEPINLAAARLYVQQRKDNLAVQLLEKLISDAERYERNGTLLEALLLKAILYQQKDDNEIAKEYMNKALYIAETNGFIRTILDEGSLIERLIIDLKKDYKRNAKIYLLLVSVEYLSRIIREFEIDSKRKEESETDLSRRELEILKLLAQKMSNNEICEALFISLSTVKTHISNILLKLDAKNRTEAVDIAKENALL
jgi:LuxR family maltose regulon positive regulatory protein